MREARLKLVLYGILLVLALLVWRVNLIQTRLARFDAALVRLGRALQ